jgi:hypothetical protein
VTDRERQFIDTAVLWRQAKHTVEEAILYQQMIMELDMVRKERRDAKVKKPEAKTD